MRILVTSVREVNWFLTNFDRGKEVRKRRPVKRLIETHMLSPSSKSEQLRVRKTVRGRGRGGRGRGRGRGGGFNSGKL